MGDSVVMDLEGLWIAGRWNRASWWRRPISPSGKKAGSPDLLFSVMKAQCPDEK
jgi:hypothetical protein